MTGSSSRIGLGKSLVTAQIAISVVLLIGAGDGLSAPFATWRTSTSAMPAIKLALMEIYPLSAGYRGPRLAALYHDLQSRLRAIPGVHSAAYSQNGLFSGSESGDNIAVEGYSLRKRRADGSASFDEVGPDYFSSVGIPILLGREIGARDNQTAPKVCVVNESFAKFFFGKANPLGKHVTDLFPGSEATMEIVGVVRDVRDHNLRGDIRRRFYPSSGGSAHGRGLLALHEL